MALTNWGPDACARAWRGAQDVYSQVADVVRGIVAADAAEGQPEAVALAGIVDRKLVKQTVMTSVYGVRAWPGTVWHAL